MTSNSIKKPSIYLAEILVIEFLRLIRVMETKVDVIVYSRYNDFLTDSLYWICSKRFQ